MTINAWIVTFLGLFIVYGGLLYLGATGNSLFPKDTKTTALLVGLVEKLLGKVGVGGLSIAVVLVCLTTAIGIHASVADFISNLTKNKISYKMAVLIACTVSAGFALLGVQKIIVIAGPIFTLLYPVSIVVVLLGVFRKYVPNDGAWKGAALLAVILDLYDIFGAMGIKSKALDSIISVIPHSSSGFAWLLPTIIGFIVGALIYRNKSNKQSISTK